MKISVIIPIYNAEKYLKQTLDSIRFQTYKNLEIVCVLDCPTDNSEKIAEEFVKNDNRFVIVKNPKNVGPGETRNNGVRKASGEYIHFMDSDDFISPDFYESLICEAEKTSADVTACSVFYERNPIQSIRFTKDEVISDNDKIAKSQVLFFGWMVRYLIKKRFWDERKLSFPNLHLWEDHAVAIPMVYYANKIAFCSNGTYFYKNREDSIVNTMAKNEHSYDKEDYRKAEAIFKGFMREHKIKRPNKLLRLKERKNGKFVCLNAPVEYGKINKKISVIIPIYNAEKYLKQTLDSIRFQTYKNLEIVCVLDCPTDDSAKLVEDIAKEDSRIKPIYNKQNMGLPKTRNIGVENASGEYIHFMDSDDLLSPDFYEVMISAAEKDNADVAACSVFYEKKPYRSIWFKKSEVLCDSQNKIDKTEVSVMGWAWRYLIRRDFWNNRKLSFPDLVPMEDMPVMIPMIYYADKVVLCPGAVYFYKYRPQSILNKERSDERKIRDSKNRQAARKIFGKFMRINKIKRPNRLLYHIKKRF